MIYMRPGPLQPTRPTNTSKKNLLPNYVGYKPYLEHYKTKSKPREIEKLPEDVMVMYRSGPDKIFYPHLTGMQNKILETIEEKIKKIIDSPYEVMGSSRFKGMSKQERTEWSYKTLSEIMEKYIPIIKEGNFNEDIQQRSYMSASIVNKKIGNSFSGHLACELNNDPSLVTVITASQVDSMTDNNTRGLVKGPILTPKQAKKELVELFNLKIKTLNTAVDNIKGKHLIEPLKKNIIKKALKRDIQRLQEDFNSNFETLVTESETLTEDINKLTKNNSGHKDLKTKGTEAYKKRERLSEITKNLVSIEENIENIRKEIDRALHGRMSAKTRISSPEKFNVAIDQFWNKLLIRYPEHNVFVTSRKNKEDNLVTDFLYSSVFSDKDNLIYTSNAAFYRFDKQNISGRFYTFTPIVPRETGPNNMPISDIEYEKKVLKTCMEVESSRNEFLLKFEPLIEVAKEKFIGQSCALNRVMLAVNIDGVNTDLSISQKEGIICNNENIQQLLPLLRFFGKKSFPQVYVYNNQDKTKYCLGDYDDIIKKMEKHVKVNFSPVDQEKINNSVLKLENQYEACKKFSMSKEIEDEIVSFIDKKIYRHSPSIRPMGPRNKQGISQVQSQVIPQVKRTDATKTYW